MNNGRKKREIKRREREKEKETDVREGEKFEEKIKHRGEEKRTDIVNKECLKNNLLQNFSIFNVTID